MLTRAAYAKVNLSLEVVARRDDGFHEIVSVMQMLDLADTLTFDEADDITLESNEPSLDAEGEDNLILKAAKALQQASGKQRGARIKLDKVIPIAAGLGGGSSDAAATLQALAELWDVNLSKGELRELGATLGSDVPFFLGGPTALVEGRGERVTSIPPPPTGWVVLVCEPYSVRNKTQLLYRSLHKKDMSDGNTTRQLLAALLEGSFPPSNLLANTFERVAYDTFDGLAAVRRRVLHAGGREVHLSGSGPTLFSLFPRSQQARARTLHQTLQAEGLRSYLTRTLTKSDL
ncbi:MAG TPA: 4-(cytidine 5'-diphospho)-2-C-methyl-D-erythritol kinase [Chloroflexia bacterium]|nr:4-(cytidine 5'-diphospho)-2-C-methyl-D-erythritol kinase [Chloroflexia bacterium]